MMDSRFQNGAFALSFMACLSAGAVLAAEPAPLSAIDWLSDSIAIEEQVAPSATVPPRAETPAAISMAPLNAPLPDRAGLLSARSVGLDEQIWGRSAASQLAEDIRRLPDAQGAPPSLRKFLSNLLIARLVPPIDAAQDDSLFLARLDRLLTMGRLAPAEQLIEVAGKSEPKRFIRAFDIALLTATETEACRLIEATPDLSPTYPARVFCLARVGKWDVAAFTLGNAEALNILTPDEDALLRHFLDPELFEGEPIPAAPRLPSPLVFRLYEAVGERLPTDQLPVAFAAADLNETVGWKTRLRAAERLAAVDAIPFERLLSVFSERQPAASGGIWDRVAHVQALLRAVETGSTDEIAEALPDAWSAARYSGYEPSLAYWIYPKLGAYELTGSAGHIAFEIALLAGKPELARKFAADTPEDRTLLAIATGAGGVDAKGDPLLLAILRGLGKMGPGMHDAALVQDSRTGEALLSAIAVLMDGATGNPDRAANALALLVHLGLEDLARQVAVELLLKEGAA